MSDDISDSIQMSYPSSDSSDSPPQRKPNNLAAAGNFTGIDSSTSSSRFHKKTRDLPNLSECQNCGFRINTTNGRDKLQTLRSEWRIVLLCRKCVRLVDSGEVCPYCFLEVSSDKQEHFRCRDCSCRVHERCVLKCKGFAPPSYYCCFPGSGFTVCLDCWLPEPLRKVRSQMVKGDSRNKKVSNRDTDRSDMLKDCANDREDSVNAANSAKVKKVLAAVKGRDITAIKPVTVVNTAADSSADDIAAIDDAGLVFQFHQSLNSSHRISKNLRPVNYSSPCIPETMVFHGTTSEFHGKTNDGKCDIEKSCSNKMISSCGFDNETDTASQSCHCGKEMHPAEIRNCCHLDSNGKVDRNHFKYARRKSSLKVTHDGNVMPPSNIQKHCQACCQPKTDRYVLKYSKRKSSSKVKVDRSETHLYDLKTNRYCFKYKRRTAGFKISKGGKEMGDNSNHCQANCDSKTNRCYLKYIKKKPSSKEISNYTQYVNIENDMHQDYIRTHFQPVCELKTNKFCLKYSRRNPELKASQQCRLKFLYEDSQHESMV